MERYIDNIHKLMYHYTLGQEALSQFIIRLGGSGKIHGCIIDVDRPEQAGDYSYTHLFVNPIDGRVTPYFAGIQELAQSTKIFRRFWSTRKYANHYWKTIGCF